MAGETPHDKKLFNKYFRVEVKGVYGKVPGIVSIDPGRVTVTVEETTQGDQPEYRTYTYGSHDYDDLTMTLQTGPGMVKLQEWCDKAMKIGGSGNALRRDISIYALARDKSTVRKTINCFGCYPISLNAGDHATGSEIKTITLTCNVDRIEVA
jgi:phage tail-like protein